MTLISSIILDAYRESNMLPIGRNPTANQATEALRLYNALLAGIYGGEAGEPLHDWPLGSFDRDEPNPVQLPQTQTIQQPPVNSRLIALNANAMTVYLPFAAQDGTRYGIADPFSRLSTAPVTLDANGRAIEGGATVTLDTDGLFKEWLYRADLSNWVPVSAVTTTDENPFPAAFDNMFIILLSMRLNPRYGRQMDPQSQAMFKQNSREFVARYLQSAPLESGTDLSAWFMSRQSFSRSRGFSSTNSFNTGRPQGDA